MTGSERALPNYQTYSASPITVVFDFVPFVVEFYHEGHKEYHKVHKGKTKVYGARQYTSRPMAVYLKNFVRFALF
jgi:fumarate reductase subunit D